MSDKSRSHWSRRKTLARRRQRKLKARGLIAIGHSSWSIW